MTISPIVGAVVQHSLAEPSAPVAASPASAAGSFPALPGPARDAAATPGTHAAPVSSADQTSQLQAQIVPGDTPGDDILAGLNKRWSRFDRAMRTEIGHPRPGGIDGLTSPEPSDDTSPGRADPYRWSAVGDDVDTPGSPDDDGAWSPVEDEYDAHVANMSQHDIQRTEEIEALQRHVREMDDGGALTLQLSKGIQGVESSIKTLVTGQ